MKLRHAILPVDEFGAGTDVVRLATDLLALGEHLFDLGVPVGEKFLQLLQELAVFACKYTDGRGLNCKMSK